MRERVTLTHLLTHSLTQSHVQSLADASDFTWLVIRSLPLFICLASTFHPTGLCRPSIKADPSRFCSTNSNKKLSFVMGIRDFKPSVLQYSCEIINSEQTAGAYLQVTHSLFNKHTHAVCFGRREQQYFSTEPVCFIQPLSLGACLVLLQQDTRSAGLLLQNCVCVCVFLLRNIPPTAMPVLSLTCLNNYLCFHP